MELRTEFKNCHDQVMLPTLQVEDGQPAHRDDGNPKVKTEMRCSWSKMDAVGQSVLLVVKRWSVECRSRVGRLDCMVSIEKQTSQKTNAMASTSVD